MNALWEFLGQYSWLWGAVFIVLGGFLCFLGRKLFSFTLFCIGTLITCAVILLVFYGTFLNDKTEAWVGWTVLSCSILLGLLGGFLLYKCQRLGACCIAGWGGFMGGLLINTTFMWTAGSVAAFWCVNVGCALIAAALAFCFFFPAIIISTSLSGSYLFFRGISLYAGGYPNEFAIIDQIETGDFKFDYWFYLYLAFIIAGTIAGCVV